jgi:hypothetical protein
MACVNLTVLSGRKFVTEEIARKLRKSANIISTMSHKVWDPKVMQNMQEI